MADKSIGERVAEARLVPIQRDGNHWTGFVNNDGVVWKIIESDDATAEAWNRASLGLWISGLIDAAIAADRQERDAAAEKRVAELVGLLAEIQWTGAFPNRRCPCCTSSEGRGDDGHHYEGCRLAAAIKGDK